MKTKIIILILLCSLLIFAGCSNNASVSNKQYEQLATNAAEIEVKSYKISGSELNLASDVSIINCLDTSLGVNSSGKLVNIYTNDAFSSNVVYRAYDYSGYLVNTNYVLYSTNLPIAIYVENDYASSYSVKIIDCYGALLYSANISAYLYINDIDIVEKEDATYFSIISGLFSLYFKFDYSNDKYTVTKLTYSEYQSGVDSAQESSSTTSYDDGLTKMVDSDGEVFGYITFDTNNIFLYNKNKKFLNNVNIESYGFSSLSNMIRLETTMCFYKNELYYDSELERGSKDTYKSKLLIIDLKTGKVTYKDDYKYYIDSSNYVIEDEKYKCAYITYYELNKKGEKSDVKMCAILNDKLKFNNTFVYDGFTNVYKLSEKSCLITYNSEYYYMDNDGKRLLNGISEIRILDDDYIIYKNQDNEYYISQTSKFASMSTKINQGYNYISTDLYNGQRIKIENTNAGEFMVNGLTLNYLFYSYAKKGIFVTDNKVYVGVGTQQILSFSSGEISNITQMTYGVKQIYKVTTTTGATGYFEYICVEK